MLKSTLVSKMERYVQLRLSVMLTVIVCFGNSILHALVMYLYHRFAIFWKLTPKVLKSQEGKIQLRPFLSVAASDRKEFQQQGSKKREKYLVVTQDGESAYQTQTDRSRTTSLCSSTGTTIKKRDTNVGSNENRDKSLNQI